jgi:hypothetical protein
MPTFNGTHGTSANRAISIQSEGFRATVSGRAGRGVYFWHYRSDPVIAVQLAIGWYEFQRRVQNYRDEAEPKGAVVFGAVEVDDESVLDCTGEVLEELALSLHGLAQVTDNDIHLAYESLVANVEKELGRPMILIKATVPQPAKMAFTLKHVIGNPAIFVVRDQFEKIKVKFEVIQ